MTRKLPTYRLKPGQTVQYWLDHHLAFEIDCLATGQLRIQSIMCRTIVEAERDPAFGHYTMTVKESTP